MLLEICCKCGFVHKDDRIVQGTVPYRAYKPHYHWSPDERTENGITLHATICVACCGDVIDWKEFFAQKKVTPPHYRVQHSLNAPLPSQFMEWATELYMLQSIYFEFD
jgi:hypothetical protein